MAVRTVSVVSIDVSARVKAAVFAIFLGAFFVWGAGMANSDALHDVAHDTRHSFGFPCH